MSEPYHLFEAFGVELEYMIVDARTLSVRPIADQMLEAVAGPGASDFDAGTISWSNELVAHVIELKTSEPARSLDGLETLFSASVSRLNGLLQAWNARLMPTAMHPWMDPMKETRLWPHENNEIYETFNRIFDCRGHGWSNLQSMHINLPFAGDEEFGRLHAAIRLLLPILPALAASSPLVEGKRTGLLDNRLDFYRRNSARMPSVAGRVIPEPVFTMADYERKILERIYREMAPHDPQGILRYEWLNARGAIARFTRNAIEIRVLDVQECPQADLAICRAVVAVLQELVNERWASLAEQQSWPVEPLEQIFLSALRDADRAAIADRRYLACFGMNFECSAGELWQHLIEAAGMSQDPHLRVILDEGPLARRIGQALGDIEGAAPKQVAGVYRQLSDCLAAGQALAATQPLLQIAS